MKTTRKLSFVLLALLVSGCAALSDFRPPSTAPGFCSEPYTVDFLEETDVRSSPPPR